MPTILAQHVRVINNSAASDLWPLNTYRFYVVDVTLSSDQALAQWAQVGSGLSDQEKFVAQLRATTATQPPVPAGGSAYALVTVSTTPVAPGNGVFIGQLVKTFPFSINTDWLDCELVEFDSVNGLFRFRNKAPQKAGFYEKVENRWIDDYNVPLENRWWPCGIGIVVSVFQPIGPNTAQGNKPRTTKLDRQFDPVLNSTCVIKCI